MIRFFLSLLVVHFCFISLISCSTTQGVDPDATEEVTEDVTTDEPAAESADEDLESELNNADAEPAEEGDELAATDDSTVEPADESELEDELADEDLKTEPLAQEETPAAEELPMPIESIKITDIRYMSNQNGGTLVIESTGPVSYTTRASGNGEYVIEVENVELTDNLKKSSVLFEHTGAFTSVGATQQPDSKTAKIFVRMSASRGEPIVQAEGNTLVVVPPAPPVVAEIPRPTPQPSFEPGVTTPPPAPIAVEKPTEGALSAKTLDEFLSGNQRFFGKPLSLQVRDADVRDVINFIADDSGANIVMSDGVEGKISLKLRKIPWDQALVTIMRTKKLGYVRQGNVLRITSLKELQEEADAASKIIDSQKAIAPNVVRVYPVSFANLDELAKNIKVFLTEKTGNVLIDNRTSTIVVTDKEAVLDRVAKLIKTMDVAPTQVTIEGKIVEATESFSSFVGVNWNMSGATREISGGGGIDGSPIVLTPSMGNRPTLNSSGFTGSLTVGTFDLFGNLSAALALAETDAVAHVISSPRVTVMNREPAVITQSGEAISINQLVTASGRQSTVQRDKLELKLAVTPQITADGSVLMDVEMTRQFAGPQIDQETLARAINTRSAKTKVMVKNGQTAVIGGIYQADDNKTDEGVPLLKDIPVLGWLFKTRKKEKNKNELLVFLTPKILVNGLTPTENQ